MENIRLIEKYLDNELKGEQFASFQKMVVEDKAFAEMVNLHHEVNTSILDNDIIEFRKQVSAILNKRKYGPVKKIIKILLPIAALIIGTIALIHFYGYTEFNNAFETYYKPYETDIVIRSAANKISEINNLSPYILYDKGEYQKAFDMLEDSVTDKPANYKASFFYGLCALELKQYNIAEENFIAVIKDSINSTFRIHAEWYLSMLYLKNNNPEKAKHHLKNLSNEHYYALKAKKILKKY